MSEISSFFPTNIYSISKRLLLQQDKKTTPPLVHTMGVPLQQDKTTPPLVQDKKTTPLLRWLVKCRGDIETDVPARKKEKESNMQQLA